jgi:putative hydrolase of the HAD superfamily
MNPLHSVKLIAFDADDTLWVNEPLFQNVERQLHDLLLPYADEATISRRLYEVEMRNLKLYGYGAKGFTLSMIETAIELTEGRVRTADIAQLLTLGKTLMHQPIELLDGVRDTLDVLENHYPLMLLTKGDLFDQESKLARSGVGDYFTHVEIVSEKDEATYRRILQRHGLQPAEFLMIGNSPKSDVLPVVALGGHAIHIPYQTTWVHEQVTLDETHAYHTVGRMGEVLDLLGLRGAEG